MGLQVWVPMHDGTLINQGLASDIVFTVNTGATVNNNGKIGKCYSFDGADDWVQAIHDKTMWSGKPVTYALWFKSDQTKASGTILDIAADLCLSYRYDATNGVYFAYWRCFSNNGSRAGDTHDDTHYYDATQWHHIAMVFDGPLNTLYVDGIQSAQWDSSSKYTYNWAPLLASNYNCISIGKSAGSTSWVGGLVNDVRIYDEALSPFEIKRISQGLMLHYPMNDPYIESSQNLIRAATIAEKTKHVWGGHSVDVFNYDCSTEALPFNIGSRLEVTYPTNNATGGGVSEAIGGSFTVKPSTTYTFSAYLKTSDNYTYTSSNFLYYYGDTAGHGIYTSTKREPVGNGWCRIWNTLVTGENQTTFSPYFYSYPAKTMTYWIGGWQLEEKDHPTPYIEPLNNREETIIYDSSGYCHNGITTNGLEFSTDTPRYITSTKFGTNQRIKASPLSSEVKTLSCWAKTTANKSTSQFIVADSASNMCITFYNGNIIGVFGTTRSTGSKSALGTSYKENEWNHFVVVKTGDAGERDIYCNGVKLTPISNDYWGSAAGFWVGTRNDSNALPFQGYISDVRAYVTAFTEEEVQLLYQNSAYISSNATTYAHEFVEE